jgi:hypothetical protein
MVIALKATASANRLINVVSQTVKVVSVLSIFLFAHRFHEYQVLKVANARKWRYFTIGKDTFFAAASNSRYHDSPVFKWVDNQFIPFQTVTSSKAFDVEPIKIKEDVFLGVAIYYGPYSNIFKWNGERFVLFQKILAAGADMESFSIGDDVYLAITGIFITIDYLRSAFTSFVLGIQSENSFQTSEGQLIILSKISVS